MATLIHIETSTEVCSVALSRDGEVDWHKEDFNGQAHSTLLAKFLEEMLEQAQKEGIKPDAVAVSCGPGSYTGLRIGVSTAKGLCFGNDIPLIAVNTLQVIANQVAKNRTIEEEAWLCPMIDARRMEVYTCFFNHRLEATTAISADIIEANSYKEVLEKRKVYCFGNGAKKCKTTLSHPNLTYIDDAFPLAYNMVELAEQMYEEKKFVDVAYFEPFYLKEFVATVAKNKVF